MPCLGLLLWRFLFSIQSECRVLGRKGWDLRVPLPSQPCAQEHPEHLHCVSPRLAAVPEHVTTERELRHTTPSGRNMRSKDGEASTGSSVPLSSCVGPRDRKGEWEQLRGRSRRAGAGRTGSCLGPRARQVGPALGASLPGGGDQVCFQEARLGVQPGSTTGSPCSHLVNSRAESNSWGRIQFAA